MPRMGLDDPLHVTEPKAKPLYTRLIILVYPLKGLKHLSL